MLLPTLLATLLGQLKDSTQVSHESSGSVGGLWIAATATAVIACTLGYLPNVKPGWFGLGGNQGEGDEEPLVSPQWIAGLFGFATVLLLGLAAYTQGCMECGWRLAGLALLLAAAAFMVGFLLGFLFGIPRSASRDATAARAAGAAVDSQAASDYRYHPNTNLEEISDWLTKILVGVGLAELGHLEDAVRRLSTALEPAFGPGRPTGSGVLGITVSLYCIVAGFVFGYAWSRVVLPYVFTKADLSAEARRIDAEARTMSVRARRDGA